MGRFFAFVLGGLALALYGPFLVMQQETTTKYRAWIVDRVGQDWHDKLFVYGPGVLVGVALLLFSVRGREAPPPAS